VNIWINGDFSAINLSEKIFADYPEFLKGVSFSPYQGCKYASARQALFSAQENAKSIKEIVNSFGIATFSLSSNSCDITIISSYGNVVESTFSYNKKILLENWLSNKSNFVADPKLFKIYEELIFAKRSFAIISSDGKVKDDLNYSQCVENSVVIPGSFNPIHYGHAKIAKIASSILGKQHFFELSLSNVDKATIENNLFYNRISCLKGCSLILSNQKLFINKAEVYKSDFAIGMDTAIRLIDKKYYKEDMTTNNLIDHYKNLGTRFIVFDRAEKKINKLDFGEINELFTFVAPIGSISSSEIRAYS
jgi:hypothetical protein